MSQNYNLESHYSQKHKVDKPARVVVNGPNSLPGQHLYNDIDARNRLKAINNDIYEDSKQFQSKERKSFTTWFLVFVASVAAALGIRSVFK